MGPPSPYVLACSAAFFQDYMLLVNPLSQVLKPLFLQLEDIDMTTSGGASSFTVS
jgi:hypothetical protein